MHYLFVPEARDYTHFASGRVFHSLPGHPAFPVRLASEIFQRCMSIRTRLFDKETPCVLYDPCCGAGYTLSVLAFLHRRAIGKIIASDVDSKAVEVASRNLEIADLAGLEKRAEDIAFMVDLYGKESHRESLHSAQLLRQEFSDAFQEHSIKVNVFRANALDKDEILKFIPPQSIDVVITDIPYGEHSRWENEGQVEPLRAMLEALKNLLSSSSVVAISTNKQQKATHPGYQRVEQFQVGKRRVAILRLIDR